MCTYTQGTYVHKYMKLQKGYLPKSIQTQGKQPSACSGTPAYQCKKVESH